MSTSEDNLVVTPLQATHADIGRHLWEIEDTRRTTLESISGVTDSLLDVHVESSANTIGALLYHIALVESSWLYEDALQQPLPEDLELLFAEVHRDKDGVLASMQGEPLAAHLSRLEAVRRRLLE